MAAAEVEITEVGSVELARIHGESNLRTFSDGFRVLRTIGTEYRRARRTRRRPSTSQLEDARTHLHPRTDLVESETGALATLAGKSA